MKNTDYHKEIDGLRAVSVLVIIFYHLEVQAFQGGFIGVDVFFVVSGYLITRIITSDLESATFSLKDFYIRRSARILPPVVATVLLVLPAALYFQQPKALVQTAEQGISALLSLSNFYFWNEASYWHQASEKFVLLHTWSLGVEEQFYLVYPLLLLASYRLAGMRCVIGLLVLMLVFGAAASDKLLGIDHSAAFYLTPLRFYEFALGGLGTVLASRMSWIRRFEPLSTAATLGGLLLIGYSTVNFNSIFHRPPGPSTLIPALGALLVLLAGPSHGARPVLMNPLMSWLGKTSYSLYLVHWPIIVFYRGHTGPHLTLYEQLLLVLAILVSAQLLNRGVERRFRLAAGTNQTAYGVSFRAVLAWTLSLTLGAIFLCSLLIVSDGWPARLPPSTQALLEIDFTEDMQRRKAFYEADCTPKDEIFCGEQKAGETNIMLLSDSRGLDIYISLKTAYPDANIRSSYAMGCAPVFSPGIGISRWFPNCAEFNRARLQAALDAPDDTIIILAQDLNAWRRSAVLQTVERLRDANRTVYLLGEFQILRFNSPVEFAIDELRFPAGSGNWKNSWSRTHFISTVNSPSASRQWGQPTSVTKVCSTTGNITWMTAKRVRYSPMTGPISTGSAPVNSEPG